MNWQKERNIAEQAALQAGARIREFYKKDPWIKEKSPKNFITQADHEANEIIQSLIRKNFPEDGWLSEETREDADEQKKERLWVVDPLDGTYEFVHSIPEFAVSIALCSGGIPVVGAVYNPATEELFSGSQGEGVFFNNVSRKLSTCKDPKEARILVSRSEFNRKEVDFLKDKLTLVPRGGTAYKLALVAAGLYEGSLSVQPKTNWDFAAGMALLKAAQALVSDNKGQMLDKLPRKVSGLCVAPSPLHSVLVQWIRDVDVPDCRSKKS
jgi:myo-inositol-1(or 4)-monophosphatase